MHNCKTTRERLTELLLDEVDPREVLSKDLARVSANVARSLGT